MRAALATIALLAMASSALADPKHAVMVFKADGNADAKLRGKIESAVVALAKKAPDVTITPGDISFSDAAAAAGCKPEAPACLDNVMATFAVDEIVVITTARKPGVTDVVVKRAAKGSPAREASLTITGDNVQVDAAAPLFGGSAPVEPVGPVVGPVAPVGPVASDPKPDPRPDPQPRTDPPHTAAPIQTAQPGAPLGPDPSTDPNGSIDQPPSRRGLYVAGMIGGGTLVLIGFGMWGAASSVQSDIDAAPARSRADFAHLADLEARGDRLSGTGNLLFLAGAILGGVSTYMFIKKGRHRDASTAHAVIMPTVIDHGGGLVFSWGAP